MRIALVGYGKMGKAIEQIAKSRGNEISYIIDLNNKEDLHKINPQNTDAVIEFTMPESAYDNLRVLIGNGNAVVCGSTGWLDKKTEIEKLAVEKGAGFFYASNFSIGVNLFFHMNKLFAQIMSAYPQYKISTEEIHHTQKKDSPSGTAITLAEGILANYPTKKKWVNNETFNPEELCIISKRIDPAPGTHTILYHSMIDSIELKHTAHSREGFATGAVVAAEFMKGKKGVFGMNDLLQLA